LPVVLDASIGRADHPWLKRPSHMETRSDYKKPVILFPIL
jgi:hypothetical protein